MSEEIKDQAIVYNSDKPSYQHIVKVVPIAHFYNELDEPEYVKYSCPVCDMANDKHQVTPIIDEHCPICNVNLDWNDFKENLIKADAISRRKCE